MATRALGPIWVGFCKQSRARPPEGQRRNSVSMAREGGPGQVPDCRGSTQERAVTLQRFGPYTA